MSQFLNPYHNSGSISYPRESWNPPSIKTEVFAVPDNGPQLRIPDPEVIENWAKEHDYLKVRNWAAIERKSWTVTMPGASNRVACFIVTQHGGRVSSKASCMDAYVDIKNFEVDIKRNSRVVDDPVTVSGQSGRVYLFVPEEYLDRKEVLINKNLQMMPRSVWTLKPDKLEAIKPYVTENRIQMQISILPRPNAPGSKSIATILSCGRGNMYPMIYLDTYTPTGQHEQFQMRAETYVNVPDYFPSNQPQHKKFILPEIVYWDETDPRCWVPPIDTADAIKRAGGPPKKVIETYDERQRKATFHPPTSGAASRPPPVRQALPPNSSLPQLPTGIGGPPPGSQAPFHPNFGRTQNFAMPSAPPPPQQVYARPPVSASRAPPTFARPPVSSDPPPSTLGYGGGASMQYAPPRGNAGPQGR